MHLGLILSIAMQSDLHLMYGLQPDGLLLYPKPSSFALVIVILMANAFSSSAFPRFISGQPMFSFLPI